MALSHAFLEGTEGEGETIIFPEVFALPEGVALNEHISRVRAIRTGKSSLILRMWVIQGNGEKVPMDALIDTGCEVNIIRTGLVPPQYFTPSLTRINLVTANGSPLGEGINKLD